MYYQFFTSLFIIWVWKKRKANVENLQTIGYLHVSVFNLLAAYLDPAGLLPQFLKYAVRSTLRWSGVQSARKEGETPPLWPKKTSLPASSGCMPSAIPTLTPSTSGGLKLQDHSGPASISTVVAAVDFHKKMKMKEVSSNELWDVCHWVFLLYLNTQLVSPMGGDWFICLSLWWC